MDDSFSSANTTLQSPSSPPHSAFVTNGTSVAVVTSGGVGSYRLSNDSSSIGSSSINNSNNSDDNTLILNGGGAVGRNSTVDEHYAFFKSAYDHVNDYFVVRKALGAYDVAKHSFGPFERICTGVETRVGEAASQSAPALAATYESYLFPTADRLYGYYNRGVDNTKSVVTKGKAAAVTTGSIGLGLTLVATQMGLIASTTATNLFLDGVIATKQAGTTALNKTISAQEVIAQYVYNALNTAQAVAKNPPEKMAEFSHSFLDTANVVFERLFHLEQAPAENRQTANLRERVANLALRIVDGVSASANERVLVPVRTQWNSALEQLAKSLALVDYLKRKREWTFDKVGQLSASAQELRQQLETEAKQAYTSPEAALIRYIRRASEKLNDNLEMLRGKGNEILPEALSVRVETASEYVQQMDMTFANAEDIYKVKNEVIDEAKQKLSDIVAWSSSLLFASAPQ
jgi:hypothetical protein